MLDKPYKYLIYTSSISKLENNRSQKDSPDRATENRLEGFENRLSRVEASVSSISKSLQALTKNVEELNMRAERSADDAYATITLLIDIVTRQLNVHITERDELQQYQQRGERQF